MRLLTLLLMLPLASNAEELCDEIFKHGEIDTLTETVALKNCYTNRKINLASKDKLESLCGKCKDDFLLKYPSGYQSLSSDQLIQAKQKSIIQIAFQEYKKSITNSLVEVAKLRSLPKNGSSFQNSIKKCSFTSLEKVKTCNPKFANHINDEITKLQGRLGGELAQIISNTRLEKRNTGMLTRNSASTDPACFKPEKDILLASNLTLEEVFSPQDFEAVAGLSENLSLEEIINTLKVKNPNFPSDIKDALKSHPLLSQYASNSKDFITFIRKLNPKDTNGLRAALYNQEAGDAFDNKLGDSCEKSFKSLKEVLCSDSFKSGDISLNPFKKLEYFGNSISNDSDLVVDPITIKSNLDSFRLCEIAQSNGSKDSIPVLEDISKNLPTDYSNKNLASFLSDKYQYDISNLDNLFCKIDKKEVSCIPGSFTCAVYKRYQSLQEKDSIYSKLANSSNNEINTLLQSMIGNPTNISPEDRVILVTQGILPKTDGKFVAQPEVAERAPGAFNRIASSRSSQQGQSASVGSSSASGSSNAPRSVPSASGRTGSSNEYYPNGYGNESQVATATTSSSFASGDPDLDSIHEEIRRRLGASTPSGKKASSEDIATATQQVYKERGRAYTPAAAAKFTQQYAALPAQVASATAQPNSDDYSRLSPPSQSEKQEQAAQRQFNALSGMSGAQAVANAASAAGAGDAEDSKGRSPASADSANSLETISLSISGDKTQNVSDILAAKMAKDDVEGMTLKGYLQNRQNFILKLNESFFKINYDDVSKGFKVSLDKGSAEAQKLIPQLESFFNRNRVTATALRQALPKN